MLLIANLIPAIVLMVLYSRRIAMNRAEQGGLGSGRLHTRLVALFSVIAAVPTVLVAIFASLLFQSGLEFWFSDRARGMLENTVQVARATYQYELEQGWARGDRHGGETWRSIFSAFRSTIRASTRAWRIRPIYGRSMRPQSSAIEPKGADNRRLAWSMPTTA